MPVEAKELHYEVDLTADGELRDENGIAGRRGVEAPLVGRAGLFRRLLTARPSHRRVGNERGIDS